MTLDLTFITQDVTRQRELARQALEEAKRLDELMKTAGGDEKSRLEDAKRKWLEMARALAENATSTSVSGTSALSAYVSGSVSGSR